MTALIGPDPLVWKRRTVPFSTTDAMYTRRGIALFSVSLAIVVLATALLWNPASRAATFHGTAYDGVAADDFELVDHRGRDVRLSDLRGRPVLLFFGFIHCPDVCPLTLERLARAVEAAGRRTDDTAILLVTVDPERDTPEALARYVEGFGERVTGLTGSPEALAEVRRAYGVHVAGPEDTSPHHGHGGAGVIHSSAVYGIDREGVLRVVIPFDQQEEQLRDDVRTLSRL